LVWAATTPVRWLLIATLWLYRVTLAGFLGGQCRFYPTCSHYAEDAIRRHGAMRGVALSFWRVLRCNPFTPGGVDEVPSRVALHDAVIHPVGGGS
jgi:hypothetical protein